MLGSIKRFYDKKIATQSEGVTSKEACDHSLKLATAALMIEISRADSEVSAEEIATIERSVRHTFSLSEEETAEIIELAKAESKESVSFYQFTHLINKGYSYEEKRHVVELLWRVVLADSVIDRHEEHYVRRIADLLHVSHKDFIETKLKAREESGG